MEDMNVILKRIKKKTTRGSSCWNNKRLLVKHGVLNRVYGFENEDF